MNKIEKAFCGYNQEGRAFVPYTGNLTKVKEAEIRKKLISLGYRPGGKSTNVTIQPPDEKHGLNIYKEDGAGGVTKVVVINLNN